jgi:hypothetical protein
MGWTGGTEELGLNESLFSNFEVRSRRATGVSRTLITELGFCNSGLEFLVKFVEVDY